MTHEPSFSNSRVIEVFSFNCPICEDAVQVVKEAVVPCGCAVFVRPWEEGPRHLEASEGGIYPVPSLAVNGRVVFHGCPGPGAFAEAIGEMSLSRPTEACASTPSEGAPSKLGEGTADSKDFPLDSVPRYGVDNNSMRSDVRHCPPSIRSDVQEEETRMRHFRARGWALPVLGVALLGATVFCFSGCNSGTNQATGDSSPAAPSSLGEPVKGDVPLACSQCMSDDKVGQTVMIEGEIVQQCPASGCWFRMKDDAGEVFVDLAPAKLRLTEKREGQHAKVTGRVVKEGRQFRLQAQYVEFSPANKDAPAKKE